MAASAVLTEAILSFLGLGLPPDIPTWGNIMAEGRQYFLEAPWIITIPGIINRDFADVKTIMAGMGYSVMGTATASGMAGSSRPKSIM